MDETYEHLSIEYMLQLLQYQGAKIMYIVVMMVMIAGMMHVGQGEDVAVGYNHFLSERSLLLKIIKSITINYVPFGIFFKSHSH